MLQSILSVQKRIILQNILSVQKLIRLSVYEIKLANGWHIRSNYNVIFRWLYFILFYLFCWVGDCDCDTGHGGPRNYLEQGPYLFHSKSRYLNLMNYLVGLRYVPLGLGFSLALTRLAPFFPLIFLGFFFW